MTFGENLKSWWDWGTQPVWVYREKFNILDQAQKAKVARFTQKTGIQGAPYLDQFVQERLSLNWIFSRLVRKIWAFC